MLDCQKEHYLGANRIASSPLNSLVGVSLIVLTNNFDQSFNQELKSRYFLDILPSVGRMQYKLFCPSCTKCLIQCVQTKFLKKLRGVHHTAESSYAVCVPPRSQAPQCASYHGVKLRGVHTTAESSSEVCMTSRSQNCRLSKSNFFSFKYFLSQ